MSEPSRPLSEWGRFLSAPQPAPDKLINHPGTVPFRTSRPTLRGRWHVWRAPGEATPLTALQTNRRDQSDGGR